MQAYSPRVYNPRTWPFFGYQRLLDMDSHMPTIMRSYRNSDKHAGRDRHQKLYGAFVIEHRQRMTPATRHHGVRPPSAKTARVVDDSRIRWMTIVEVRRGQVFPHYHITPILRYPYQGFGNALPPILCSPDAYILVDLLCRDRANYQLQPADLPLLHTRMADYQQRLLTEVFDTPQLPDQLVHSFHDNTVRLGSENLLHAAPDSQTTGRGRPVTHQ